MTSKELKELNDLNLADNNSRSITAEKNITALWNGCLITIS